VVGDLQIASQIKHAYQLANELNVVGPFLHRLMHTVFVANKRIVNETVFRDGTATVTYQAFTLALRLIENIKQPKILVLGLGEVGYTLCKYLTERGFDNVTIMTRTLSKAENYAKKFCFEFASIEDLDLEVTQADIVLSSLRNDTPAIKQEMLLEKQNMKYKYLIDLSVPHSIELEVETVPGVFLYNIETINTKVDETLALRLSAIPEVENIIEDAILSFKNWTEENLISPTIKKFKNALNIIRKEEINRYLKTMSEEEAEKVNKITENIIQKIIKLPVVNLKSSCSRDSTNKTIEILSQLFDLENDRSLVKK
jgi:glutamyl-tRNA reductase